MFSFQEAFIKMRWVNMDARFAARVPMFLRNSILEKVLMTVAHAHTVRIWFNHVVLLTILLSDCHDFMLCKMCLFFIMILHKN